MSTAIPTVPTISEVLSPSQPSTSPYPGHLYTYAPNLVAFDGKPSASHSVLWIGGLYASLDTRGGANLQGLEEALGGGWGVVQSLRSSSGLGWGQGSVRQDAVEIALLVEFLAKVAKKQKLVIVGHSTGTQDIIAFFHLLKAGELPISAEAAAKVVGATLLAAASDREFIEAVKSPQEISLHTSPPSGLTWEDFIPLSASSNPFGPARITYRRWRSLVAKRSDVSAGASIDLDVSEDFFSTDLPDVFLKETVFRPVDRPLQVLLNGEDETFLPGRDRKKWFERLQDALPEVARTGWSGIVEGADHSVTSPEAQKKLYAMLGNFLKSLE